MTEPPKKQTPLPSTPQASPPKVNSSSINPRADHPNPKLRLHINDIRHPGSKAFLSLIPDLESVLESSLSAIIQNLYTVPSRSPSPSRDNKPPFQPIHFTPSIPPTRSITLLLRDIPGVAYTTGTELDTDHKEIHLSLSYIHHTSTTSNNNNPAKHELHGILTHELVHCYQHTSPPSPNTGGHPPSGLIEGIADFVRLKANLAPPHWKRPTSSQERPERWDQGYQHTAYFLAWLEDVRVGRGAVGLLNDRLLRVGYEDGNGGEGEGFWEGLFGSGVQELWCAYGEYLDGLGGGIDKDGNGDGDEKGRWEEIVNPESEGSA